MPPRPGYPPGQGTPPLARVPHPPGQGTPPPQSGYPPARVHPGQGTPRPGYPLSGYPPGQDTPPRLDLAGYPPQLDLAGYPPSCPMAFWEMLQSIMGYGYPPPVDRQIDGWIKGQTRVKTLPL